MPIGRPRSLVHAPPEDPAAALAYWEHVEAHLREQIRRHERLLARAEARSLGGVRLAVAWIVTGAVAVLAYRAADLSAAATALLLLGAALLTSLLHTRHLIATRRSALAAFETELAEVDSRKRALAAAPT